MSYRQGLANQREMKTSWICLQERDHMEHKLDELQQQDSRLGPSNLSKHDQITELEHEVLHLTAENEVRQLLTSTLHWSP